MAPARDQCGDLWDAFCGLDLGINCSSSAARRISVCVDFPAQDSVLNGAPRRMRAIKAQVNIARWVTHGRAVAYSYSLIPVAAHRADDKWIIDSIAACIFFATFIDDKGDSVFRVLVPDRFTADLVPTWAKPK